MNEEHLQTKNLYLPRVRVDGERRRLLYSDADACIYLAASAQRRSRFGVDFIGQAMDVNFGGTRTPPLHC